VKVVLALMVVLMTEVVLAVKVVLLMVVEELWLLGEAALVDPFRVETLLMAYPFLLGPGLVLQEVQSHLWSEQFGSVQEDVRHQVSGFPYRQELVCLYSVLVTISPRPLRQPPAMTRGILPCFSNLVLSVKDGPPALTLLMWIPSLTVRGLR
jgi:hypothetical protein